jgi:hypothetical protein
MVQDFSPNTFDFNLKKPDGKILRTNIYLLGRIISEMKRGYSPIIVIVGKQRTGKSFFAIWLCAIIHHFFHDSKFDPAIHTSYDPLAVSNIIDVALKEPILIDEAGAIYNKQEWYEKVTRAMGKILQTQGFRCNCYIFVAPFGNDIVKDFRKHFDYICHTTSRGNIIVKKVIKKYDEINDVKVKTHYYERIHIYKRDVDAEIWTAYERYSIAQKKDMHKDYLGIAKKKAAGPDPFGRKNGRSF